MYIYILYNRFVEFFISYCLFPPERFLSGTEIKSLILEKHKFYLKMGAATLYLAPLYIYLASLAPFHPNFAFLLFRYFFIFLSLSLSPSICLSLSLSPLSYNLHRRIALCFLNSLYLSQFLLFFHYISSYP